MRRESYEKPGWPGCPQGSWSKPPCPTTGDQPGCRDVHVQPVRHPIGYLTEVIPMHVKYASIPGFTGYRVGTDGSVWSCRKMGRRSVNGKLALTDKWHTLKTPVVSNGYPTVALRDEQGLIVTMYVHKLVLEAFVGPCPLGMEACHYPDRTKTNCSLANLRYGTPKENSDDQLKHGTRQRGEKNGHAILTEKQVLAARRDRVKKRMSIKKLASVHGCSRQSMSDALSGRTWKHLPLHSTPPE